MVSCTQSHGKVGWVGCGGFLKDPLWGYTSVPGPERLNVRRTEMISCHMASEIQ